MFEVDGQISGFTRAVDVVKEVSEGRWRYMAKLFVMPGPIAVCLGIWT